MACGDGTGVALGRGFPLGVVEPGPPVDLVCLSHCLIWKWL